MSTADAFFQTFPAPDWWRKLDTSQRILAAALVISTIAHAGVLAVRFTPPDLFRLRPVENKLDVILVNAKHAEKPAKAEALAQVNLDGGGEAQKGRAKSFLPTSQHVQEGDELRETAVRIRQATNSRSCAVKPRSSCAFAMGWSTSSKTVAARPSMSSVRVVACNASAAGCAKPVRGTAKAAAMAAVAVRKPRRFSVHVI